MSVKVHFHRPKSVPLLARPNSIVKRRLWRVNRAPIDSPKQCLPIDVLESTGEGLVCGRGLREEHRKNGKSKS